MNSRWGSPLLTRAYALTCARSILLNGFMDRHLPTTETTNLMGWFEGRIHHYKIHIFYEDTDFSGIVYHANYLKYFERGRSSFLNLIGVEHNELWDDHHMAFIIRKMTIDYKHAAKVDDRLIIKTSYNRVKGARLFITQECYRGEDLVVSAECEAACINKAGRPIRASGFLMEKLDGFLAG